MVGALGMALIVALLVVNGSQGCRGTSGVRRPAGATAHEGVSTKLPRTRIVPTLDAPLLVGTNLIWCASFQLAWKELAAVLKERQPVVGGAETLCGQLNAAPDPRDYLPVGSCYAMAGEVTNGIVGRIREDMSHSFPSARLPDMEGFQPGDLVAYGFLEANIHFTHPYIDSDAPVAFRESRWFNPKVKMFGVGHSKTKASPELRSQVSILFRGSPDGNMDEFALDLDRNSSPCQLIVARLAPQPTLAAATKHIEDQMALHHSSSERGLGPHDTLLVPEMDWRILHNFAELEGRQLRNSHRSGDWVKLAAQSVSFRLDRSGVALESHAILRAVKGRARHFEFDRPFLIYLKKRGADQPFFVAWIDNAELLRRRD